MSDDDGSAEVKKKRVRNRGAARIAAASANAKPDVSRPPVGLTELEELLDDEEHAISVLRPSALVFFESNNLSVDKPGTLDPSKNTVFASHEIEIRMLQTILSETTAESKSDRERLDSLVKRAEEARVALAEHRVLGWKIHCRRSELASLHSDNKFENDKPFARSEGTRPLQALLLAFAIVCVHIFHHATNSLSNSTLSGINLALMGSQALNIAPAPATPRDIRTALSWFPVDADFQAVACCPNPECCKLYPADEHNRLPRTCDAELGAWKCNWVLTREFASRSGKMLTRPIRTFNYQSPKSWIGALLARPGMENLLEGYARTKSSEDVSVYEDIWHTTFFRNFRWAVSAPAGQRPKGLGFISEDGDLRLLFSLAIDWFTAHGGKQAGKKWSIGAIYLVCQNLPLEIRFKPENVCLVGIIPGRTKPLGYAINQFLTFLVDEFVEFYQTGVFFTRTYQCPVGRLVRAALGPVVCDLDAARGVAGVGSVKHRLFCTLCDATSDQMANFSKKFAHRFGDWKSGFAAWTNAISSWLKATTREDQAKHFKLHGIRWTELAKLPYWNPFHFLVIDPMHNLFLGLLRRHLRFIWCMDVDTPGWGDEVQVDPGQLAYARQVLAGAATSDPLRQLHHASLKALAYLIGTISEEIIQGKKKLLADEIMSWKSRTMLTMGPSATLPSILRIDDTVQTEAQLWVLTQPPIWKKLPKPDLLALCDTAGIVPDVSATKNDIERAFKERLDQLQQQAGGDDVDTEPSVKKATGKRTSRVTLGRTVLTAVSSDIKRTILPDWLDPVPATIGSTKHGKLSANHWRVFCTVHCVITLIRLWGLLPAANKYYRGLENFIYLVKAVDLATRRSTSRERCKSYGKIILHYLRELQNLYPAASITPNHHLSTHLGQFLLRFGPPHSWWAFPFERYNGILQRFTTNDVMGSMEVTMMKKFIRHCRLSWLVIDQTISGITAQLYEWALERMRSDYTGTLLLENDAAAATRSWSVVPRTTGPSTVIRRHLEQIEVPTTNLRCAASIRHRGMTFQASTSDDCIGNSIVHIKTENDETMPARIQEIAYSGPAAGGAVSRDDVWVRVKLYENLSPADAAKDPYNRWRMLEQVRERGLDCHLRYGRLSANRVVPLGEVVGHAAMCPYEAVDAANNLELAAYVFLGLDRS